MQKISSYGLQQIDIIASDELNDLLHQLFKPRPGSLFPDRSFKNIKLIPPLLLYQENRTEKNQVLTFIYYGGRGDKNASIHHGIRGLLDTSLRHVGPSERGHILNSFCQLDFCLDAMVLIDLGVFSNKTTYSKAEELFKDEGSFGNTNRKIKYLHNQRYLKKDTYELLQKARKIRNTLAHQFMPIGTLGVAQEDIEAYGDVGLAVQTIFNASWIYLMRDYNPVQTVVAKWLHDNST